MKHIYLRSILLICIIVSLNPGLFAQDIHNESLGTVSNFIKKLRTLDTDQAKLRRKGNFKLDKEGKLIADIKRFSNDQNLEIYSGKVNGEKNSNVVLEIKDNKISGTITLPDTKKSFKYNTDAAGEVVLTEVDINKVICIDYDKEPAKKSKRAAAATSAITVTALHSNINAPAIIYLDFDGEVVNSPEWGQINALPSGISDVDIYAIWSIVAEDFAPFNVDVTTERATYNSRPFGAKHMNIFTPTDLASPGMGGVAIMNSFTYDHFCPSWSFNLNVGSAGVTASHEVGHTLGLTHDGLANPYAPYFTGHNNWGPIMGAPFNLNVTQWSKGEYYNALTNQDDLATITRSSNKVAYKTDDYGNTIATASLLKYNNATGGTLPGSTGTFNIKGVIAKNTDVDVFKFAMNTGTVSFNISAALPQYGYPVANLDIKAEILDANGTVLATSNPAGMNASFSMGLMAGTYYLRIDGTGTGNPVNDGYSDYGSIGTYTITGGIYGAIASLFVANVTYPEDGAELLNPDTIRIKAAVGSPVTAMYVEYWEGNVRLGTSYNQQENHYLDVSNLSEGTHTIYVKALNQSGTFITSAPITFKVYRYLTPDPNTANKRYNFIWDYYEGAYSALPNFNSLTPVYTGLGYSINLTDIPVRADNFAIRYSGFIHVGSKTLYKFSLNSDDGSKLYIGNKLVVNNDGNHAMQEVSGKVALVPGYYPFSLEYYEATGGQDLILSITDGYDGSTLYADFYHNDFEPLPFVSIPNKLVQGINYEYNEDSYDSLPNFNNLTYKSKGTLSNFSLNIPGRRADNFAVRFSAIINTPYEGLYKFFIKSDDGSELYIDDNLVVSNNGLHDMTVEKTGSVWLSSGSHKIKVEYFEKTGVEDILVSYSGPGIYKQTIPASALSRNPVVGEQVPYLTYQTNIPGVILSEYYDQGGEGYAYHDNTPGNQFNLLRTDGVDITEYMSYRYPNYWISNIQDGEWVEYTVNATKSGPLHINTYCSSGNGTSKFHLEKNNTPITPVVNVPVITDGSTSQNVKISNINFTQGEQVIKVYFDKGGFMVDYLWFEAPAPVRESVAVSSENLNTALLAFPNPFEDYINFDLSSFDNIEGIRVVSLNGTIVWESSGKEVNKDLFTLSLAIPSGMYILEIDADDKVTRSTIVKE